MFLPVSITNDRFNLTYFISWTDEFFFFLYYIFAKIQFVKSIFSAIFDLFRIYLKNGGYSMLDRQNERSRPIFQSMIKSRYTENISVVKYNYFIPLKSLPLRIYAIHLANPSLPLSPPQPSPSSLRKKTFPIFQSTVNTLSISNTLDRTIQLHLASKIKFHPPLIPRKKKKELKKKNQAHRSIDRSRILFILGIEISNSSFHGSPNDYSR